MNFKPGDLVKVKPSSTIYSVIVKNRNMGIVKKEAVLMYYHDWETDGVTQEYWAYDVIIEGKVHRNVPEEALERFGK